MEDSSETFDKQEVIIGILLPKKKMKTTPSKKPQQNNTQQPFTPSPYTQFLFAFTILC